MKNYERCLEVAKYIIKNNSTVREAAKVFKISKSTIHKDVTVTLKKVNPELYRQASMILLNNKNERHMRGGLSTKAKYLNKKGDLK